MPNDRDEFVPCLVCGALVSPAVNRIFAVGCEDLICMECALRRGGAYDESEDRWGVAPHVDDLLDEVEHVGH